MLESLQKAIDSVAVELLNGTEESGTDAPRLEIGAETSEVLDTAARLVDCFLTAAGVGELGHLQDLGAVRS